MMYDCSAPVLATARAYRKHNISVRAFATIDQCRRAGAVSTSSGDALGMSASMCQAEHVVRQVGQYVMCVMHPHRRDMASIMHHCAPVL